MTAIRELIDDAIVDGNQPNSIVKPYVISHGTLECRSLRESRKFYQEVLGLECVVHSPTSMAIRCGLKFHIIAVEVGDALVPANILNHWGVDVQSREEVDVAYAALTEAKERVGILQIKDAIDRHGIYGFYFQDLDTNWWEVQYYPGFQNEDLFDFGDRYELPEKH